MPNDMQILNEIRQLTDSMPRLKAEAKEAAAAYRAAIAPAEPARAAMLSARGTLKAVRARLDELMQSGEE